VLRDVLEAGLQDLIDAEATARIGAGPYEHTDTRVNRRNGAPQKTAETPAGEVTVDIPKLRKGSFFPALLHPRRRVDKALWAVICQAWVNGVSTRKVDRLVKALGCETGISKSQVSRVCAEIDGTVDAFLTRRLDQSWYPYVYLDATFVHTREHGRMTAQAVVVATGVAVTGRRAVLGLKVADVEDPAGVMLVISDAHCGIQTAISRVLPGASWQRCPPTSPATSPADSARPARNPSTR
jgi:transposase-like protein